MKVLSVFGTRPGAVKFAPVIRELERHSADGIQTVVCVTGQHREMLDQAMRFFHLEADYDLDLMKSNQRPWELASRVVAGVGEVIERERPDWVLVQGDTTTSVSAALAAGLSGVRVGHIEAGLRTGNKWRPFPEELNRRVTGVLADLHLAPTERARENLLRSGVAGDQIVLTGNTVVDALRWVVRQNGTPALDEMLGSIGLSCGETDSVGDPRLVLITAHRRESFGEPLEHVGQALRELAELLGESVRFVYPVHLNPAVHRPMFRILDGLPNVHLVPPLDYFTFVQLMKRSYLVVTDSGGIQEEAPSLGVPVLVLREETERPEGIEAGVARMVGTDRARIVAEVLRLMNDPRERAAMSVAINLYGDGRAAERVVRALKGMPDSAERAAILPPLVPAPSST